MHVCVGSEVTKGRTEGQVTDNVQSKILRLAGKVERAVVLVSSEVLCPDEVEKSSNVVINIFF